MTAVLALLSLAEKTEQKPPDLSEKTKLEVAIAQRDYLLAKARADQAMLELQAKITQAEKECQSHSGLKFDATAVTCRIPEPEAK